MLTQKALLGFYMQAGNQPDSTFTDHKRILWELVTWRRSFSHACSREDTTSGAKLIVMPMVSSSRDSSRASISRGLICNQRLW